MALYNRRFGNEELDSVLKWGTPASRYADLYDSTFTRDRDGEHPTTDQGVFLSAVGMLMAKGSGRTEGPDSSAYYAAVGPVESGAEDAQWGFGLALDLIHVLVAGDEGQIDTFAGYVDDINLGNNNARNVPSILRHENFEIYKQRAKLSSEEALVALYLLSAVASNLGLGADEKEVGDAIKRLESPMEGFRKQREEQADIAKELLEMLGTDNEDDSSDEDGKDDEDDEDGGGGGRGRGSAGAVCSRINSADACVSYGF